nr:maleylpyruvate isomerase family mycothiol-dependent enzyme [Cellulomonas endophytica]
MDAGGTPTTRRELTAAVVRARAALADDLAGLDQAQWRRPSLCDGWTVHDVVAHLVAAARTGRWAWLRSIAAARFDADLHNARRLAQHRGADPAETLARFRATVDGPAGPTGHTAAWLGEVLVHGEDVRRPLGLTAAPDVPAATAVAQFFARRDFAVPSSRTARGLRLEAADGPFRAGAGPLVQGPTLALVLAMAGRPAALDDLGGEGVEVLRGRIAAAS